MSNKKDVISEEDKIEMEAEVEEGMCYGNFSNRAKACKECMICDECKEETSVAKK